MACQQLRKFSHLCHLKDARWLEMHTLNPFTIKRNTDQYLSKAAYKLEEIHKEFHLFKKGHTVIDLGFAPGAWSQYTRHIVGDEGLVIGVDIIPARPPVGITAIQGDFTMEVTQTFVTQLLKEKWLEKMLERKRQNYFEARSGGGRKDYSFGNNMRVIDTIISEKYTEEETNALLDQISPNLVNVVISDMCGPFILPISKFHNSINQPYQRMLNTGGSRTFNHLNSLELCESALQFSTTVLLKKGHFLCKFMAGSHLTEFENECKKHFKFVTRVKPKASSPQSSEIYILCKSKK